ncbi:Hsp20/alpha crystallin family protein [Tundrisphaera sp. TA3]|uniref:Hsp20/alpha crystallin family protein n=1 Tax=Tundrisphaera sp. TA3 TaxID=3435775 RepID=UPI003EBB5259
MVPATRNHTAWVPTNRMDALFNHVLGGEALAGQARAPLAMWEDDDHVWVEAEMPGVKDEDVDITIHKDLLTITAVRKPEEGRRYLYNGRSYGRFERTINLPEAVNPETVQASLEAGVLRIEMPKSPESKPRKISLKTS